MTRNSLKKNASIALFRTILLSFVRVYWRPTLRTPDRLPRKGPCFFYGNHSNRYDPFILNCFTPWGDPTGGVMTREYFRGSFLATMLGSFDIHPTRKRIAEPHLIRTLFRMIDAGRKIVIYPEGGSRWAGRPEPWIESTAKVFIKSGVPVYPVVMHGSYVTWPRWATYPRPGRVEVEVLEPLTFDRKTPLETALPQLKAPLAFNENEPPERLRPRWAYRPADGIHKLLYRDPVTGTYDALFTPDGTTVVNREGSLRLKMLPDSRLRDESTGMIHTTGDLYDQIKAWPLTPDSQGVFLRHTVALSTETTFPNLIPHGSADATLYNDAIRIESPALTATIPLADLQGVDIERSYKLQLTLADRMVQLGFTQHGSALGWKNAILELLTR